MDSCALLLLLASVCKLLHQLVQYSRWLLTIMPIKHRYYCGQMIQQSMGVSKQLQQNNSDGPAINVQLLTSAGRELYLSLMAVFFSTPYSFRKLLRALLPPACIFFSCSGDQASIVTDLKGQSSP